MPFHRLVITALAASAFLPLSASAQDAHAITGPFRGVVVCEKMPDSPDILRAPFDLEVVNRAVQYARPIFNWNGARVLGSELGNGTLDGDGKIRLAATWAMRGVDYRAEYDGMLTATGGTLIGTQSWRGSRRQPHLWGRGGAGAEGVMGPTWRGSHRLAAGAHRPLRDSVARWSARRPTVCLPPSTAW